MAKNIVVLIGSASKTSFSQLTVRYLQSIAPADLQLNVIDISQLPLYNRDLDENSPEKYTHVREAVAAADGILWVSPEHNGAISAMLKNAIDVVSRPMGQSKWMGKPLGIITVGAGMAGGIRVADQMRVIASSTFINMPVYPVNASIGNLFGGVFDNEGNITVEPVRQALQDFINGYAQFVDCVTQ